MLEVHGRSRQKTNRCRRPDSRNGTLGSVLVLGPMNSVTTIGAGNEHAIESQGLRRVSTFVLLSAGVAAIFSQSIAQLLQLAWTNDAYSHILLILPLSLALVFVNREDVFAALDWASAPGLGVAASAGALSAASYFMPSLTLSIATLAAFWLSCFMFCFGLNAFRKAAFPLLILAFLIPLPVAVTGEIAAFLQRGSAEVAYRLLQIATVPVSRDGVILSLPGLNLEVAAECSGLRSSMLLLITSLVIAYVHLRGGWRQIIVALLVVPISILKNGIRVFTLATASAYLDHAILSSWLHHNGGFLFFLLGLGLVICAVKLLQKAERKGRM
jgi:exosortase